MSPGARLWASTDLRRRWASLLVLGLIAGLTAGLALASLAGARRTDTAFDRLRDHTTAADAIVFPSQVGAPSSDWDVLRAQPYVEAVAPWTLLFGAGDLPTILIFGAVDDTWFQTVDRPIVLDGRPFDPDAPTEVVVDEAVRDAGFGVGDTFDWRFYAPGAPDDGSPPTGPELTMEIVGVVRTINRYLFTEGLVAVSPAFVRDYGAQVDLIENAHVRLRHPSPVTQAELASDASSLAPGTPVLDLHRVEARVGTAIDFERLALVLLAGAVAIAGAVLVGQAISRSIAALDDDQLALAAIGATRGQRTLAVTLPHLLAAALAGVVAPLTAYLLSPRFPIGYTGTIDPGKGWHFDTVVLVPGAIGTAALVGSVTAFEAWRRSRSRRAVAAGGSRLAEAVRAATPLPIGLGVTMAIDPGRGRQPVPVRPALVAAVVGMLGLGATLSINHALSDAIRHPELAGVTWDAQFQSSGQALDLDDTDLLDDSYAAEILDAPEIGDVTVMWRAVIDVDGVGVPALAPEPLRGSDVDVVVLDGRAPTSADEVAVGPATARQLGISTGDTLTVSTRELRVVGRALFAVEVHNGFDEGLWVMPETLRAIAPPPDPDAGTGLYPGFFFDWSAGTDPEAGLAALTERFPDALSIESASVPQELDNLRNVRTVPLVLAGFLLLLAVASLLHALLESGRARRRDFAVFRALGGTRRLLAVLVAAQATTIAVVGLVIGIPLGLILGRLAWAWLSDRVPIVFSAPMLVVVLMVVALAALLAANVLAALAARLAVRGRPAAALRAE